MTREVDCIVWCPTCKVDKFTVYRVETRADSGVFVNEAEPAATTHCTCGEPLERKP